MLTCIRPAGTRHLRLHFRLSAQFAESGYTCITTEAAKRLHLNSCWATYCWERYVEFSS
jgi:hypothetical protein